MNFDISSVPTKKPQTERQLADFVAKYFETDLSFFDDDEESYMNLEWLRLEIKSSARKQFTYLVNKRFRTWKFINTEGWTEQEKARAINALLNSACYRATDEQCIKTPIELVEEEVDACLDEYNIKSDMTAEELYAALNDKITFLKKEMNVATAISIKLSALYVRACQTFFIEAERQEIGKKLEELKKVNLKEEMQRYILKSRVIQHAA